jgi:hypothetical protein
MALNDMDMNGNILGEAQRRSFWVRADASFDASWNRSASAAAATFLEDFG